MPPSSSSSKSTKQQQRSESPVPHKKSSDATSSTSSTEYSGGPPPPSGSPPQEHSLTRRSLADRARVFDKTYVQSSEKKRQSASSNNDNKAQVKNHLQNLLDESLHRKQANVIHGRKQVTRDANNPGTAATILDQPLKDTAELQALVAASKGKHTIYNGIKDVHHPSTRNSKSAGSFSIIPNSSSSVVKPKPFAKGSTNLQKLLDASEHKKLLQTSSAHRLAHRMMQGSQHTTAKGAGAFTFNLRKVKNRIKPALPKGVTPLKPTETTFQNVQAPKLRVNLATFEAPTFAKSRAQESLLHEAMASQTYVLKRHTPAAMQTLVQAMEPVELRKGQILQRQGESRQEDDHLYVVEEGHVDIQVDGKIVETLRKGQTFGQERLLMRTSNHATIQSGSHNTKLFRLNQTTFRAVLQQQYQSVLDELKAKTPKSNVSSTWKDDIYNKKQSSHHHQDDDDDDDEYVDLSEEEEDEDDLASFAADSASMAKTAASSIKSGVVSKQGSTTKKVPKKETKKKKQTYSAMNFEDSPVFQQQEALRRSAQKYAPSKDDLEFIKVLGEGQFGEVWLVAASLPDQDPTRQEFALKIQKLEDEDGDEISAEEAKDAIRNEIKALQNLHHPFIVNLVHTYEAEDSMDMMLGLIPGGELWDKVHREEGDDNWVSGIAEGWARFYAYVLADTLGFMHSQGYIFRDLKPENIMLDQDGYPIIVDFGFAKYLQPDQRTFTFCGTPNYVAPEIITNEGHGKEADYWALGIVIYEMVSGENPFFYDGMEQSALYEAITEEDPYEMSADITASDQVRELADLLFIKDPAERLGSQGVQEILEHSWFLGMPDLSEIHAKRVDPNKISELIYEEEEIQESVMDDDDDDDDDSFAETEHEPLKGVEEEPASPVQVELPKDFGKAKTRANSFKESRSPKDISIHSPRRHSVDNIAFSFDEEEEAEDEAPPLMSPTRRAYNPNSPKSIKYWTPHKKGKGYFAKMKSPEERRTSKTRQSLVGDFLSQYLGELGLDVDDEDLVKAPPEEDDITKQFNKSSFF